MSWPIGGSSPPPASAPQSTASTGDSFKDKVENFFAGSTDKSPQPVSGSETLMDCPLLDIRQGASTLIIGPSGPSGGTDDIGENTNNGAMSVKYQGSFVRAARSCAKVGDNMVMKVGIQGRIIVGPAGGPGNVNVPLRIAVVRETPAGTKPIATKFVIIPVTVASQTENPTFTYVADDLTFPMPPAADLDSYLVYIGFDPLAEQAQERPKPKTKIKPKRRSTAPTG